MKKLSLILACLILMLSLCACSSSKVTQTEADALLSKYYQSVRDKNFDLFCECFPQFYVDALNKEIEEYDYEYWDSVYNSFVESYGADFTIRYEITGLEAVSKNGISDAKAAIAKAFSIEQPNITAAYLLNFKEYDSGSLGSDEYELEFYVIKIDGKAYLYDTFYENEN